jgi:hypothetical protein
VSTHQSSAILDRGTVAGPVARQARPELTASLAGHSPRAPAVHESPGSSAVIADYADLGVMPNPATELLSTGPQTATVSA